MNVRKPVDYSAMFAALDTLMAEGLPQMELYCEIGRLVSGGTEKGAAVAAAEYLCGAYPDASDFSPRNLRRMREFYRTYETAPEVLAQAKTIGWTQNIVILEAELTLRERVWYIQAARQLCNRDHDRFDLLIGMDKADLWYTDDFEATWRDVLAGCQGLLDVLRSKESLSCLGERSGKPPFLTTKRGRYLSSAPVSVPGNRWRVSKTPSAANSRN